MGLLSASLLHSIQITNVPVRYSVDTFLNVVKRREAFSYKASLPSHSSGIAYISNPEITTEDHLSVVDRSTSLVANRINPFIGYQLVEDVFSFEINTDKFLLTDIFTEESPSVPATPIFYKHSLSQATRDDSGDLDTSYRLISIEFLDEYMSPFTPDDLYIDYDQGIVYNNLSSSYTSRDQYTVYYIQYTIRAPTNVVYTYVDILNNTPVFSVATIGDLLLRTRPVRLDPTHKAYLINEIQGGYQVTLPTSNLYAYQPLPDTKISLYKPLGLDLGDPWYVRITNNTFYSLVTGRNRKYYIAEFMSQSFDPYYPLKKSFEEDSLILSKNIIRFNYQNIYQDSDLYVDIEIYDKDGNGVAAFTTDPSKDGTTAQNECVFYVWSITNHYGIRSIDNVNGLVDIEGLNLRSDYEIVATYYYTETFYEFTAINFNPAINQSILTSFVSIFLDPTYTTKSVYYLIANSSGQVTYSDHPLFDNDAQTWSSKTLFYESIPSWMTTPVGGYYLFLSELSTAGTGKYLVLGDIYVSGSWDRNEMVTLDTRRRGGGISVANINDIEESEVKWYWDMGDFDGIPYPEASSFMVELPVDILTSGTFTGRQIRNIVDRHVALGTYPSIRTYGTDVTISGIDPGDGQLTLTWLGYE